MAKLVGTVNLHVMERVLMEIEGVLNGVNFLKIPF